MPCSTANVTNKPADTAYFGQPVRDVSKRLNSNSIAVFACLVQQGQHFESRQSLPQQVVSCHVHESLPQCCRPGCSHHGHTQWSLCPEATSCAEGAGNPTALCCGLGSCLTGWCTSAEHERHSPKCRPCVTVRWQMPP